MTKIIAALAFIAAAAIAGGAWYWASHLPAYAVTLAQQIDHHFLVAAYTIAWVVQLSYLTWLGLKWCNQKKMAERLGGK
jgi:hypothetical protein